MTYARLKKLIERGAYNKEDMLNKLDVFLMANRITEEQYQEHFQKGESLLTANSNHILIKFKSSKHEHDLVTTDREDLAKQVEEKRKALQRKNN